MNTFLIETGVAAGSTIALATSVNAEPLLTALIGFGVSLVTMAGGELVKYLVAYFKNKTKKLEQDNKDDKNDEK